MGLSLEYVRFIFAILAEHLLESSHICENLERHFEMHPPTLNPLGAFVEEDFRLH